MGEEAQETGTRATFYLRSGARFEIVASGIIVNREGGELASVIIRGATDRIAFFKVGEIAAVVFHDEVEHHEPRVTRLA
jgi:hypothetical protein